MRRNALALLPLLTLAACNGAAPASGWRTDVALQAPGKVGGCAVGELLEGGAGREIAAVCQNGDAYVVWLDGGTWRSEVAARTAGEMIQCAIGDVDPSSPGNELVLVGMLEGDEESGGRGAAYVVRRSGERWVSERIFEDSSLIHGVCVGDLDATRPGLEVLLVGFSLEAHLATTEGDGWNVESIGELPGPGKNAVPFLGGAAVACADGSVVWVGRSEERPERWETRVLGRAPAGQARLDAADRRLVVCADDGELALIEDGERTTMYRSLLKLRGAVLADLDPDLPGLEAGTAGYERTMIVLHESPDGWVPRVVHEDADKFHHAAAGDVDLDAPGDEFVACGFTGRVIVARRR